MSQETGIPLDNILNQLYENTAKKKAKKMIQEDMKPVSDDDEENGENQNDNIDPKNITNEKSGKSQKKENSGGQADLLNRNSPRLQKEMSNKSLNSRATEADSSLQSNNLMKSRFSFGL